MQSPDLKFFGTRSVIPPSFASNMQVYGTMSCSALEAPLIIQTEAPAMMPLSSDFSHSTIHPVAEPILHQHNQLVHGPVETQMTFSNLDARSIENATPHDSSPKGQHQSWIPTSVLSSNSLMLLEEQLLSLSGLQEYANDREPMLDNSRSLQLRSHGCKFANSPTGSNIVPQFGISKGRCCLLPGDTTENCRSPCLVSSSWEVCQMLDSTEHSDSIRMLLGSSKPRVLTSIQKSETVLSEGHQREDNLLQALDIAATEFGEHSSCSGSALVSRDGWLTNSNTFQENSRIKSSACAENDTCATPSRQNIMENDRSESLQASNERAALSPVRPTSGNDLFDLFGINYQSGGFHGSMHDVYVHGNNADSHKLSADASTCITQLDMGLDYDALNDEICYSGLFSEASPDQLLGAVVAQINSVTKQKSNDNISCKTSLTRICDSSIHTRSPAFGWIASSAQMPGECLGLSSALVKSEVAGSSSVISRCSMDKTGGCSQKDGASISQINLWVNNGQNIISDNISAAHGQRIDEAGKLNRKRPRPGENPRPRPKDRQMIQDRVKELREIVPNGAKCSIDALLEKTIKHMLFLQSVTKHADKLKEVGEPKIMSKEGGLLLKDNFEGGVTWAFEVGTQSMICPIIVEDLNPPRQMLVEMLCEERGLFLEIADLIRGLGLTILKGVMEARSDKVWARFAVEANRDVTRMEIFLSLVRLLEPNARSGIIPRGIESLNMPHNMLRPSSIPATGLADRLR